MLHFKPNLFIPGAAKSGTTSLHNLLNQHPEICMSSVKEPGYWKNEKFKDKDFQNIIYEAKTNNTHYELFEFDFKNSPLIFWRIKATFPLNNFR